MDATALAAMRPLEREAAVRQRLREDRERILREPRPRELAVFAGEVTGGACAVIPLAPADLATDRRRRLADAAAGALAVAAGLPAPISGADQALEGALFQGHVAIRLAGSGGADAAELFAEALVEQGSALDRLGVRGVAVPAGYLDQTEPLAAPWLWAAEMAARVGGLAAARRPGAEVEAALARLAATRPPEEDLPVAADPAHADPNPRRRVVRRILRRLDGMGKYGGYHTEVTHLARGFPGHERRMALDAGDALVRAGLLAEKLSVGQRHVSLVAARTDEIRRLVDTGDTDAPSLRGFFGESASA